MRAVVVGLALTAACAAERTPIELTASAGTAGPAPAIAAAVPAPRPAPTLVAIRAAAHAVLSARCGECHESHRPTAKPAALAIFDLDRPDWPARFDAHRFAVGLARFSSGPPADRQAFIALRDAELARR